MRQAKDRGRELEDGVESDVRRLQATERGPGPAVRSILPRRPARRTGPLIFPNSRRTRVPWPRGTPAARCSMPSPRKVPWLMGGSGDLSPSTKTLIEDSGYLEAGQYENRNIAWGVREHAMCGCSSGLAPARRDSPLRGDVLHLHRLRPARHSPGRDDGTARDLHHDARLHRPGRGRPHAPARRAPGLLSGHAAHVRDSPGRRQRDRLGLAGRHDAQEGPDDAPSDASESAHLRPHAASVPPRGCSRARTSFPGSRPRSPM